MITLGGTFKACELCRSNKRREHFRPAQSLTQSGRKCSNWPETIAAVAVVHRLIVVTCDVKDFTPAAILGPFP
jgi:predicted nucleic acid-binding protein